MTPQTACKWKMCLAERNPINNQPKGIYLFGPGGKLRWILVRNTNPYTRAMKRTPN